MSFDEPTAADRHKQRVVSCTSCGASMVFLENPASGKQVPVDAETVEVDDQAYDSSRHTSHFKTCSSPEKHSRRR